MAGKDLHLPYFLVTPTVDSITGSTKVYVNTAINLTCSVHGDPFPNVHWLKDGSKISTSVGRHSNYHLVVMNVNISDDGSYECITINRAGNDSMVVRVVVIGEYFVYVVHDQVCSV